MIDMRVALEGCPTCGSRRKALTDREVEVFRFLGQGLRSRAIAEKLGISPKTVETYRDKLQKKLELENSLQLYYLAIRWMLLEELSDAGISIPENYLGGCTQPHRDPAL